MEINKNKIKRQWLIALIIIISSSILNTLLMYFLKYQVDLTTIIIANLLTITYGYLLYFFSYKKNGTKFLLFDILLGSTIRLIEIIFFLGYLLSIDIFVNRL